MHPHNLVFSPVTLKRLVDEGGLTNAGAEMHPSQCVLGAMVGRCVATARRAVSGNYRGHL